MDLYELLNRLPAVRDRFAPPETTRGQELAESLSAIARRFEPTSAETDQERPVFVLSAGWGSGSTLLQRLLISSGELAIWGEPLDRAAFIQRLCTSLSAITPDWPPASVFKSTTEFRNFANKWVANLTPGFGHLKQAHRAFFTAWFGASAAAYGIQRWGLKETRLTIDHARYLKWLFPRAKFLFLIRNPFDAYRSCKGTDWYHIWPDYRATRLVEYGYHWRHLAEGFLAGHQEVDGVLVKFEDLAEKKLDLVALARYLDVGSIDPAVLETKKRLRGAPKQRLNRFESALLGMLGGSVLRKMGYSRRHARGAADRRPGRPTGAGASEAIERPSQ